MSLDAGRYVPVLCLYTTRAGGRCSNTEPACAETAVAVRKALKARFPDVPFSVRSKTYADGASISVHYTNGPKPSDVTAITERYTGATFDGSEDLKSYHDSMILTPNGPELVSFGADFIFVTRSYDRETWEAMRARVLAGMDTGGVDRYGFLIYREGFEGIELFGGDTDANGWTHRVLRQMELPGAQSVAG